MTKEQMIRLLLERIDTSDSVSGEFVLIRKSEAVELVQMLSGTTAVKRPAVSTEGKTLFYCADCSRSFWADGREDRECFEKWKYHTWYAQCPHCGREVSQNDRYWR